MTTRAVSRALTGSAGPANTSTSHVKEDTIMMHHRILRLAMVVFLTYTSSAVVAAKKYSEVHYGASICNDRTLLHIMHPGNTEDWFFYMEPKRPSGYLTSGDQVLHRLVRGGDTENIKALLEAGLGTDSPNDHGLTPLMIAATLNHTDIVTALLEAGADPNWTSENAHYPCMTTALHWAGYFGHSDVVAALLRAGADKDAAATNGMTPMDWASLGGDVETMMAMLKGSKASDSGNAESKTKIVAPE